MVKKKNNIKVSIGNRIALFFIGLAIAVFIFIFTFDYENLPFEISIIGYNITTVAFVSFIVLTSILSGSLIKSALLGKYRLD